MRDRPSIVPVPGVVEITRRRWSVAALGVALVAGSAWWGLSRWRDTSTTVEVDAAVEQFADLFGGGFTGIDGLPQPGVYRYVTTGSEGIDILSKPRHDYPTESAIVISPSQCGVRVEWMPLEERSEWWEMCLADGGIEITRYGGMHEFFGNRDERTLTCERTHWLVPAPEEPVSAYFRCTGTRLVHEWSWEVLGRTTMTVDGEDVDGVRVRARIVTGGEATGTTVREMVLSETGLPLLWEETTDGASDSPLGAVNHDERFTLMLASLVPER